MALKKDGRQFVDGRKGHGGCPQRERRCGGLGRRGVGSWSPQGHPRQFHRQASKARLIPHRCWLELKRRQLFDADSAFGKSVLNATEYLIDVAEGRQDPIPYRMRACEIILDRFIGKPTERHQVDTKIELVDAPWAVALRSSIRSGAIPARSSEVAGDDDIVDAEIVEPDQCECGCGQPPRPGSMYFNARHQQHAESKAKAPAPERMPVHEVDPILYDDDDDFIEDADDPDDPILW